MSITKQTDVKYWVHTVIGLLLMFGIQFIPPIEPITEIGMQLGGIFIGAIYLWSTVGIFWPSLLGIIAVGFTDYADMYTMFNAFAGYLPLMMLFGMMMAGALGECGLTQYIGRWFLTRKLINGHPFAFNFFIMLAMFFVSGFVDPLMALLVLWPTMYEILDEVGYKKEDTYSKILIVATFVAVALGQATLPFFGGQLIILGAFEGATGIATNYGTYILFNLITSIVIMLGIALLIKFVLRPDMSKMINITVEQINKNPLPPMNLQQKIYTGSFVLFLVFALLPSVLPPDSAIAGFFNRLTLLGFIMLSIVFFVMVKIDGKPLLEMSTIQNYILWDLYFLVVLAIFLSNCLLDDVTGIKPFMVNLLMPLFGGHSSLFFMVILIVIAGLITNVANNAVSGAVLMQIIAAAGPSLGITNLAPLAMTVLMASFLAVLTPAGSPYSAVLHANKERVSMSEILKYGSIFVAFAIVIYIVIGLPVANVLF